MVGVCVSVSVSFRISIPNVCLGKCFEDVARLPPREWILY